MLKHPSRPYFKGLYIATIITTCCLTLYTILPLFGENIFINAHQRVNNNVFYLATWSSMYDDPTTRLYKCNALAINCSIVYEGNENEYTHGDRFDMEFNEAAGEFLIYRRNPSIRGRDQLIYTYAIRANETQ